MRRVCTVLVVVLWWVPSPCLGQVGGQDSVMIGALLEAGPEETGWDVRPRPGNVDQAVKLLTSTFRAEGTRPEAGTAHVWLLVDSSGRVRASLIRESSGLEEFDAAARAAGSSLRFVAGERSGAVGPGWVSMPFTFQVRDR